MYINKDMAYLEFVKPIQRSNYKTSMLLNFQCQSSLLVKNKSNYCQFFFHMGIAIVIKSGP